MKDSKIYAKKIVKLYREMKKTHGKTKKVEYEDPIEAIIFGVLCEYQSMPSARSSLRKINRHFVDLNDLRVSRPEELIEVLAIDGEEVKAIAEDMLASLNAIYSKFDGTSLMVLKELGKRQGRKELEDLEKISTFAISYCFLTALDGHAIPVSKSIADYLRVEELVHPKAKAHDIEGFLERQNKSDDAFEFFMLLKAHSDAAAKKTAKKIAKELAIIEKKAAKKSKSKKAKKEEEKPAVKKAEVTSAKKTEAKTEIKADEKAVKKVVKMAAKKIEKKDVKKAVKKTTKKTAKKAVKKTVIKTVKKAAKKTTKKAAKSK